MSEPVRCPACGALVGFQRLRPRGFWEKGLARLAGLKPYQCSACLSRILRRTLPLGRVEDAHPEGPLAARDGTDEFSELIREIAEAEHQNHPGGTLPRPKPPLP